MHEPIVASKGKFSLVLFGSLTLCVITFALVIKFGFANQEDSDEINPQLVTTIANTLTANPHPETMETAWRVQDIKLKEGKASFKVEVVGVWFPIRVTKLHPQYKAYVDNLKNFPDFLTFAKTEKPQSKTLGDLVYPTGWSVGSKEGSTIASIY